MTSNYIEVNAEYIDELMCCRVKIEKVIPGGLARVTIVKASTSCKKQNGEKYMALTSWLHDVEV